VQYSTAVQLKGAAELNRRMVSQSVGSVGPAGMLLADDTEMYERNQRGVAMLQPEWLDLRRGLGREWLDERGLKIGTATGRRHAQSPPSELRRVISNVEVLGREGGDTVVGANFVLAESRERGVETWAGRVTYRLRTVDGQIRLEDRRTGRLRFLDALELETIIWLPDGHLTQLLDPSADRWRDA
jgi:hypothetical protein